MIMVSITSFFRTAVAMVVGAFTVMSAAHAEPVSDWADLQAAVAEAAHPSDGVYDVTNWQGYSKTMLAIFEAANAVDRHYQSYLGVPKAPRDADINAAVATAAHDTLIGLYPAQASMIDDATVSALAAVPQGDGRRDGIAAGHAAAVAALAAGGRDPAVKPKRYWPTGAPGVWSSTAETVISPLMATFRPWFLTSHDQFRPGPPLPLTDASWAKDLDEVRRIGEKTSAERSPLETFRARFWANYDEAPAMRAIAEQPGRSLVRNARFYALVAMARDDNFLVVADGKLHYSFWRPVAAIRAAATNGAQDGATALEWEPLLPTPMHPEYPCGHCERAAMMAALFESEGAAPPGGLRFINGKMPGLSVTVPDAEEYAREVSFSRICAGVHFRSTAEVSEATGRKVAAYVLSKFAPPL